MPVAIFLLVLTISSVSVLMIERAEDQRELSRMRATAQSVEAALERRASTWSSYLRAGAALFSTTDQIDPVAFGKFVDELRLDSDFRGSEGIGWAQAIESGGVAAFESKMRAQGFGEIKVTPRPDASQQRLVPVTYLQPQTIRNLRALGYDMYSEPVRRQAMDEASRVVSPTASGRIVLVQEGEGSAPGFLIYMPVFDDEGGARKLRGFVYSPFNAQDFLASALQLESRDTMGIKLYDGAVTNDNLLAQLPPERTTGKTLVEDVQIANRSMRLVVESSKASSLSLISMLTLLFGLAVATLLMLIVRLMTKQAHEDQAALDWLEEQHSIRDTLTRELNHRVKNTLANVLSIVALTRRRTETLDEFANSLDGRIRALSATHDLLTESEWGTTAISQVVEAELAPYADRDLGAIDCSGPQIEIAPNDALSLGLALHELATNATKFGALSDSRGSVSVTWQEIADDLVQLTWKERGGPPVSQSRKRGFGTDLLERIVAHELDHPVQLSFEPDGVVCKLIVPIREPIAFRIRAKK